MFSLASPWGTIFLQGEAKLTIQAQGETKFLVSTVATYEILLFLQIQKENNLKK